MTTYALIYDQLSDEATLDDAEAFLLNKLKMTPALVADFFSGKPVIKGVEPKVSTLQSIVEKAGIKVLKERPPIEPEDATLSHIYAKLLSMESQITTLNTKVESTAHALPSEVFNTLGKNFKDGLSKASSVASSLKDSGSSKLTQLQATTNDRSVPTDFVPQEKPTGFNWMAFMAGGAYYSGYGNLRKGYIICAMQVLLLPLILVTMLYCGFKANKELPVKQVKFSWLHYASGVAVSGATAGLLMLVLLMAGFGANNIENIVWKSTPQFTQGKQLGAILENYSHFSETDWSTVTTPAGVELAEFQGTYDLESFQGTSYRNRTITQDNISTAQDLIEKLSLIARFGINETSGALIPMYVGLRVNGISSSTGAPVTKEIEDSEGIALINIAKKVPNVTVQQAILEAR
jgi:hypothetical protein